MVPRTFEIHHNQHHPREKWEKEEQYEEDTYRIGINCRHGICGLQPGREEGRSPSRSGSQGSSTCTGSRTSPGSCSGSPC